MGELRALRWSNVDFGRRLVHVRRSFTGSSFGPPKSQRVRSVPLSDPVARALDHLSRREHDTRPDDLVFSLGHNLPFHHDPARKRFYAALEAAGLGRLCARRTTRSSSTTCATRSARSPVQAFPVSDVKAMMGHAGISTTMIYVHHVPQTDAAARLSAALERDVRLA
jgi:integrase